MQIGAWCAKVAPNEKKQPIEMKYTAEIKWIRGTNVLTLLLLVFLLLLLLLQPCLLFICHTYSITDKMQICKCRKWKVMAETENKKQPNNRDEWVPGGRSHNPSFPESSAFICGCIDISTYICPTRHRTWPAYEVNRREIDLNVCHGYKKQVWMIYQRKCILYSMKFSIKSLIL